MKMLMILLFSLSLGFDLFAQSRTVNTTNIYSIRLIHGEEFTNIMCICYFGDVMNISDTYDRADIGAYQIKRISIENRTIITFDIQNVPLTISNNPISDVTLTVSLQNQQNGIPNGIIDIYSFYNENQVTTNYWMTGTYYKSFVNWPNAQNVDVTSLVKSAISNGYTNLNLKMSTTSTNASAVFVAPAWRTNKTSLIIKYSPSIGLENPKNLKIFTPF